MKSIRQEHVKEEKKKRNVHNIKFLYYCTSVLKSPLFTPNFFPLSFLSIPDLSCPSEIRTFRCYEGTAYKLRPSFFGTYLWSPESVILLPNLTVFQNYNSYPILYGN
jgi:hypothetical protein